MFFAGAVKEYVTFLQPLAKSGGIWYTIQVKRIYRQHCPDVAAGAESATSAGRERPRHCRTGSGAAFLCPVYSTAGGVGRGDRNAARIRRSSGAVADMHATSRKRRTVDCRWVTRCPVFRFGTTDLPRAGRNMKCFRTRMCSVRCEEKGPI